MRYSIEISPTALEHLCTFPARQRVLILDSVEQQLSHQPKLETRNRKRMRPNPLASWELRIGNLRVYYDVEDEIEPKVQVLAIGVKERNRVWVGKEVLEL